MSDPTIPILKRVKEVFESKREAIDAVITHVTQTIALLEDHDEPAPKGALPAHEPKQRKIRKVKAEKSRPAVKSRANSTRLSEEQIIDAAIGAIRKNGPMTVSAITKAIKKAFPHVKGGIGKALRAEALKIGGRVARDQKGLWTEKTTAKHVDVKRTPDEVANAFAQARRNRDNEITDQVRA
jgi:hypothetical protein